MQKLVSIQVSPIVRKVILAEAKLEGLSPEEYLKAVIENKVLPGTGYRSLSAYLKDDIDKSENKAALEKWEKFFEEEKRAEVKKKPEILHISEFQDRCEQYGNNDDACYVPGPHQYKPCCAEHCPYCDIATDENFLERNLDPSKNDGNYVIPFYDPSELFNEFIRDAERQNI